MKSYFEYRDEAVKFYDEKMKLYSFDSYQKELILDLMAYFAYDLELRLQELMGETNDKT